MKKYAWLFCLQLLTWSVAAQEKKDARIAVDLHQTQHKISPLLYGQFIEFLGRCIDGGIYEEKSSLSDNRGFRQDVLKHVRDLRTPLLRYPGGTVVKIYHWKDGIGPLADRPKRKNLIWGGVMDNHFGTAEFVTYCREIGAEPFLVVNMSTDTPQDAADWVEYCNGTEDTYWANLRRQHGYPEPFQIKYWGIGNEEYAEPDAGRHQQVDEYIQDSWHIIKLMKLQDPTIKITLVGHSEDMTWNNKVLAAMHPVCDFLSIHLYAIPGNSTYSNLLQSVEQYNTTLQNLRRVLKEVPAQVNNFPAWYRFPPRPEPVQLALDEWGIWDLHSEKGTGAYRLEYPYNWSHALAVGKFLHMFQRNSDIIGLATWAQLVNVLSPITTTPQGVYRQTIYTPLHAYRQYSQPNYVPLTVDAPESSDHLKLIDATASISDDKQKLVVAVLNLSEREAIKTSFHIKSPNLHRLELQDQITYTAPSLAAVNTFEQQVVRETVVNHHKKIQDGFSLTLPPASIHFLIFHVSNR